MVSLTEHLGDILVTAPLLRGLRTTLPTTKIIVVVSTQGFPLVQHCPYADKIVVEKLGNNWGNQLKATFGVVHELRSLDISAALIPKDVHKEGFGDLTSILAPCGKRISRARPQLAYRIKPFKFALFYDEIIVDTSVRHEVEQRLEMARRLGGKGLSNALETWLTPEDRDYANRFLTKKGIDDVDIPIFAFGIGASAAGRQWPLEKFALLIDRLAKQIKFSALLIISPSEAELAFKLASLTKHPVHYSTIATVRQSIALLEKCRLFVGNDSGPMHMAASVGVPVVEISGHPLTASPWSISSPLRFGPYGVPHRILQPKAADPHCEKDGCISKHVPHCILNISPEQAYDATCQLLGTAAATAVQD